MISDLFEDALSKAGTGKELAAVLDICPSDISKIRSGTGKLSLKAIDRLVEYSGLVLVPKDHDKRLKDALKTVSALWAAADK